MRYEKVVYIMTALIIIVAAIMNIMHIPYGNTLFVLGVLAMLIFQNVHLKKLKARIRDLEDQIEE